MTEVLTETTRGKDSSGKASVLGTLLSLEATPKLLEIFFLGYVRHYLTTSTFRTGTRDKYRQLPLGASKEKKKLFMAGLETYVVTISTRLPLSSAQLHVLIRSSFNRHLTSRFLPARASKIRRNGWDSTSNSKCDDLQITSVRLRQTTGDFSESSYLQNFAVFEANNVTISTGLPLSSAQLSSTSTNDRLLTSLFPGAKIKEKRIPKPMLCESSHEYSQNQR
jgi:hypothetical protein